MRRFFQDERRRERRREQKATSRRRKEDKRQKAANRVRRYKESSSVDNLPVDEGLTHLPPTTAKVEETVINTLSRVSPCTDFGYDKVSVGGHTR